MDFLAEYILADEEIGFGSLIGLWVEPLVLKRRLGAIEEGGREGRAFRPGNVRPGCA